MRREQGRWEKVGACALNGKDITVEALESTASRCRIAFDGTCVATVSKLYLFGHHTLDWILTDLSRSISQYFAKSSCDSHKHWSASTADQWGQHAYDICTLLLESCSLHTDGNATVTDSSIDSKFAAPRLRENARSTWNKLDGKECMEFLAVADECLRRPRSECFTGPLATRRHGWTGNPSSQLSPEQMGEVHEILRIILSAVLLDKTWSGAFFITSDGLLGIGPETTQPGDQIVVLDGARSPFVLRALKNSSDYALLGDSFVLGLMHGEVRDMEARGELKSRKFVIQ